MHKRDASSMWNEISSLVSTALGLSMLAGYECASVICDEIDRKTAQSSASTSAVEVLRKADAMLEDFEKFVNLIPEDEHE